MYLCIARRQTEYDHGNGGTDWHEEIEVFSDKSRTLLLAKMAEWQFSHMAFNIESRNDSTIKYRYSPIYEIAGTEVVTPELLQGMGAYRKYEQAKAKRSASDAAYRREQAKREEADEVAQLARLKAKYPEAGR
jgi:hypothetical protein